MFKYEYDRKRTGEQSYLERMMEKEKIGKYIRKKRIEKGMTQQQLAEKIQVTEKAVSRGEYQIFRCWNHWRKNFMCR